MDDVDIKLKFYDIVRKRSKENVTSFKLLYENKNYGNCVSILRQELDSYLKVLFLQTSNQDFANNCMIKTLNNEQWVVTDAGILNRLAGKLHGWEKMVYKLGCAFIHLSNFHNYTTENPFQILSENDRHGIIDFIEYYHGIELMELNMYNIIPILPLVMKKINENLQCAVKFTNCTDI